MNVGAGEAAEVNVSVNDLVALMVEIAAFVLLAVVGWRLGSSFATRALGALALPVSAGVLWGLFAAPKARVTSLPLAVAAKVVVLGGAVLAAAVLLPAPLAGLFAVVVVVNTVLVYVGPLARPR
jgi:hypothetical protein